MKFNPEEEGLNSELKLGFEQDEDLELEEELLREIGEEEAEEELKIQEALHRSNAERRRMRREQQERQYKVDIYDVIDLVREFFIRYRTQITWVIIGVLLIVLTVFMSKSAGNNQPQETTSQENEQQEATGEETSETAETAEGEVTSGETTVVQEVTTAGPALTIEAEPADSEIVKVISEFYKAYQLSGDMAQVEQYLDSSQNVNTNQLAINKKYIESVSDFVCYKSNSEHIPEDSAYTVVFVTWKMKFYNYDELLPSVAMLFLTNGESGYKIHNMTADDVFVSRKIAESDANYLELVNFAAAQEQALLAANQELNNVFTLFREGNTN